MVYRNVQWFRGGFVFKAHRLLHHSAPGSRVITKKEKRLGNHRGGAFVVTIFISKNPFLWVTGSGFYLLLLSCTHTETEQKKREKSRRRRVKPIAHSLMHFSRNLRDGGNFAAGGVPRVAGVLNIADALLREPLRSNGGRPRPGGPPSRPPRLLHQVVPI